MFDPTDILVDGHPSSRKFIRGDGDGDGRISLADAIVIMLSTFDSRPLPCLETGDVNDNANVDLNDVMDLLRFIFGDGTPPSAPYPDCGPDPSSDALSQCTIPRVCP